MSLIEEGVIEGGVHFSNFHLKDAANTRGMHAGCFSIEKRCLKQEAHAGKLLY